MRDKSCANQVHSTSDYDTAIDISEKIAQDEFKMGVALAPEASLVTICIGIGLGIWKYPVLLGVVAIFFVSAIVAAVKYNATKKLLRAHDLAGASAMFPTAKLWYILSWISFSILAIVELYCFFQLLKGFGDALSRAAEKASGK